MLKGFWFFKLSHSALLAYFIGKTELKILSFVCTLFHFFRQGKILKLSVDGLTLKTETLASPSSRYDLKIISYDIFFINYFPFNRLRRTKYHIGGFTPRAGDASGADNIKCCLFDYYNKFAHYTRIKAHPSVMTSFYSKIRIKNCMNMNLNSVLILFRLS